MFDRLQDPKGATREWECAYRPTRKSECDGVAVIVFIKYPVSNKEEEILLISQYRPPVAAEVGPAACDADMRLRRLCCSAFGGSGFPARFYSCERLCSRSRRG